MVGWKNLHKEDLNVDREYGTEDKTKIIKYVRKSTEEWHQIATKSWLSD